MGVHSNKMTPIKNKNDKNKNNINLNKNDNDIMTPIIPPLLPHSTQRHNPYALTYLQINHNNNIKTHKNHKQQEQINTQCSPLAPKTRNVEQSNKNTTETKHSSVPHPTVKPRPKLIIRSSSLLHRTKEGSLHPIGLELASAEDYIINKGTPLGIWPGRTMSNAEWKHFQESCLLQGREPRGNYLNKENVLDSTALFEEGKCPFWYSNNAHRLVDSFGKKQENNANVRTYDGKLLFFTTKDIPPHGAIMRPYGRRYNIRLLSNADVISDIHTPSQSDTLETKQTLNSLHMMSSDITFLHHLNTQQSPAIATDTYITHFDPQLRTVQRHPVNRVLFDTGCPHMNAIDPSLLDSIIGVKRYLDPQATTITLGDASSTALVREYVYLELNLPTDSTSGLYRATLKFYVLRTGFDLLIGLKDIIQHFKRYLCDKILKTPPDGDPQDTYGISFHELLNTSSQIVPLTLDAPAWEGRVPEAPEEKAGPWLSTNSSFLHHLSIPYEDHVKQYQLDVQANVAPELLRLDFVREALFKTYLDVWCPRKWHGIYPTAAPGVLPVRLKTLPTLPPFIRQPGRSVPLKLQEAFKKEWDRLSSYIYIKKGSPYASNLTIASKKTPPFIRIAGDYRVINQYIARVHEPLPLAQEIVQKSAACKYFLDLDLTNGYHQLPLHPETQELLSVQTQLGQFCPIYLPEGVGPASSSLQSTMREIFEDDEQPNVHVLMDNLLVGCDTILECGHMLCRLLQKCKDTGVTLKMAKSKLGMSTANFFGIVVGHNTHTLDPARAQGVNDMPYPKSVKQLRGFLGVVNFFLKYLMPQDAHLTYPLYEATSDSFAWTEDNIRSLEPHIDSVKQACKRVLQLHAPNYNLSWILRTDASQVGCGAVLLQRNAHDALFPDELVPIGTCAHKFSGAATRWSTIEQEAFAIFWAITVAFSRLLFGKQFVVETDHNNLRWMESSSAPKIIRWRLALQEYDFRILHIKGKENFIADHFSRMNTLMMTLTDSAQCSVLTNNGTTSSTTGGASSEDSAAIKACKAVHNDRNGHHGASRTFYLLFRFFPGHQIPFSMVQSFVDTCPWCLKVKTAIDKSIEEPRHSLSTMIYPSRGNVGVDVLTMPESRKGNNKLLVCVTHDTKKVRLFPISNEDQLTVARCLFIFFSQEGKYTGIATDPGSVFFSDAVKQLNTWLGLTHKVSLVDRHESNGVERTNRSILEHLKFMTLADRCIPLWDEPEYIVNVERLLNTYSDYENGISPQELTTGSPSLYYYTSLFSASKPVPSNAYLQSLNTFLSIAHEQSHKFHQRVIERRKKQGAKVFYEYTPGELVLAKVNRRTIDNKLKVVLKGPFRVINSDRGNVECEHLAKAHLVNPIFHISRLTPYTGRNDNTALEMAMRDEEQFLTTAIKGYRGEPNTNRMYMTFLVQYNDGDLCWVQYNMDLKLNLTFIKYIESIPELVALTVSRETWIKKTKDMDKLPVVAPDEFYMDLRALGFTWYDSLQLKDSDTITYRIKVVTEKGKPRLKYANIRIPDFNNETMQGLRSSWFFVYAKVVKYTEDFILVDKEFLRKNPSIMGNTSVPHIDADTTEPAIAGTYAERKGYKQRKKVVFKEDKTTIPDRVIEKTDTSTNDMKVSDRVLRSQNKITQLLVLNNNGRPRIDESSEEQESSEQRNSSCTSFAYPIPHSCTCIFGTRSCILHTSRIRNNNEEIADILMSLRGNLNTSNDMITTRQHINSPNSDEELTRINSNTRERRHPTNNESSFITTSNMNRQLSLISPLVYYAQDNRVDSVSGNTTMRPLRPIQINEGVECTCNRCLRSRSRLRVISFSEFRNEQASSNQTTRIEETKEEHPEPRH